MRSDSRLLYDVDALTADLLTLRSIVCENVPGSAHVLDAVEILIDSYGLAECDNVLREAMKKWEQITRESPMGEFSLVNVLDRVKLEEIEDELAYCKECIRKLEILKQIVIETRGDNSEVNTFPELAVDLAESSFDYKVLSALIEATEENPNGIRVGELADRVKSSYNKVIYVLQKHRIYLRLNGRKWQVKPGVRLHAI